MYFGHYQIASRHRNFDELSYYAPTPPARPSLLASLIALLRRFFH